jgi:hypothetical protein
MADSTIEKQGASAGVPGEAGGPARAVGAEAGQLGGRAVLSVQQHHRVVRQLQSAVLGRRGYAEYTGGQVRCEDGAGAALRQPLAQDALAAPAVQVAALTRPTQAAQRQRVPRIAKILKLRYLFLFKNKK